MLRRLLMPAVLLVASSLTAQTATPTAMAGTKVSDLSWLEGHWTGKVNGGALDADLIFSAPSVGTIVGVARISQGTKLAVVELISLIDARNGPELRFRHFGGDLSAYEPDFQQNMALSAVSDSDLTFTNQVAYQKDKMATQPRITRFIHRAGDVLVGHSQIIGDDGKPAELESVYHRVK